MTVSSTLLCATHIVCEPSILSGVNRLSLDILMEYHHCMYSAIIINHSILFICMQHACSTLNMDVISIDLSERVMFQFRHNQIRQVRTATISCQSIASSPGLLSPAFVACSTASDKHWGEKAWERG